MAKTRKPPVPKHRRKQESVKYTGKSVKMLCSYGPFKEGAIRTVKSEGPDWVVFAGKKRVLVNKNFVTLDTEDRRRRHYREN